MSFFDRGAGLLLYYDSAWETAIEPTAPTGGTTIDAEITKMLSEIVEALKKARVFAPTI